MDKFLGRLTFGFVLGQLAPGLLLAVGLWLVFQPTLSAVGHSGNGPPWAMLFVLAAFLGITLDLVSWSAHGVWDKLTSVPPDHTSIRFLQHAGLTIALGPATVLFPVIKGLVFSRTAKLVVREHLPWIPSEKMEQFEWLQNFHLYPAQFAANASLALSLLFLVLLGRCLGAWQWHDFPFLAGLWVAAGLLQVLSIRTYASLFDAERRLTKDYLPSDGDADGRSASHASSSEVR